MKTKSKNYKIITTEKDFYKINHFNFKDINYLKVLLEIDKKRNFI